MSDLFDVTIIGGGVVGLATAMAMMEMRPGLKLTVLEAENRLAAHQTGNNSGVIHSGIYYKPGSLKAKNCVEGRMAMYEFAQKWGITHENCGKLIVATRESELKQIDTLMQRGATNGLPGLRRLKAEEIKEFEPYANGIAGIFVPQTGIIDYTQVTNTYAKIVAEAGGLIQTNARVTGFKAGSGEFVLQTAKGEVHTRNLVNCGGLLSDRVAKMCGVDPGVQIIPFRGEYYEVIPERQYLVKNLIYPVPDPAFPFLGVHFTRMAKGGVEAGPNAVLAFKREGYKMSDISIRDIFGYLGYWGFWRMGFKYWTMAVGEYYRSFSKKAFVKALNKLLPELKVEDVHRSGAGVRAQALGPNGALLDDFHIREAQGMVHVLNAPSPAATASITIGKSIAQMAAKNFNFG